MKSSELLLSSAERFAVVTATSANISGEQTLRQSRLNIGMYSYFHHFIFMALMNLIPVVKLESSMKSHLALTFSFHLQMI